MLVIDSSPGAMDPPFPPPPSTTQNTGLTVNMNSFSPDGSIGLNEHD